LESPSFGWVLPFVLLLMSIAVLPLVPATHHWWEKNGNKFLVAAVLGIITIAYYEFRDVGITLGGHSAAPGTSTVLAMLHHAVIGDYIPFIILLFSLYAISGGIQLSGDLEATPRNNTIILAIGSLLASAIGTTGAAMLLIRPLLQTNSERKRVKHTVIFFIFLVCNLGGCLLPLGDPPLFMGYLRGVPFLWTFSLWHYWLPSVVALLVVYFIFDKIQYGREDPRDVAFDHAHVEPLKIKGKVNFLWLLGVVLCVALLVPGRKLGDFLIPDYFRETVMLLLVLVSVLSTPRGVREANRFTYSAIIEVAALFIGIFITMQVPLEILRIQGTSLGITSSRAFFWFSGILSSFLDNTPTYLVFFETAHSLPHAGMALVAGVPLHLLIAISIGSVFMGANTYIGNGPNFMVRSIAEESGIKMPSFFGYMLWAVAILVPLFIVLTFVAF
jgi:Na+/H+ antiporter NhaD/arsenite permease-like protein